MPRRMEVYRDLRNGEMVWVSGAVEKVETRCQCKSCKRFKHNLRWQPEKQNNRRGNEERVKRAMYEMAKVFATHPRAVQRLEMERLQPTDPCLIANLFLAQCLKTNQGFVMKHCLYYIPDEKLVKIIECKKKPSGRLA